MAWMRFIICFDLDATEHVQKRACVFGKWNNDLILNFWQMSKNFFPQHYIVYTGCHLFTCFYIQSKALLFNFRQNLCLLHGIRVNPTITNAYIPFCIMYIETEIFFKMKPVWTVFFFQFFFKEVENILFSVDQAWGHDIPMFWFTCSGWAILK